MTMAFDYSKFQLVLAIAIEDAKSAASNCNDDFGTCNMDSAEVNIPNGRLKKVEAIAEMFGLSVFKSESGYFVFTVPVCAQGTKRTKQAEAMSLTLKEHGFNASVYYHMN